MGEVLLVSAQRTSSGARSSAGSVLLLLSCEGWRRVLGFPPVWLRMKRPCLERVGQRTRCAACGQIRGRARDYELRGSWVKACGGTRVVMGRCM